MKTKFLDFSVLDKAGRWDIDFHLPQEKIQQFSNASVKEIRDLVD